VFTPYPQASLKLTMDALNKRIHLGSTATAEGIIWFTLVFEYGSEFFVERYNDSHLDVKEKRLQIIPSNEFKKHLVNGVSLRQLVDEKFKEIPYGN
jgi:hypothetical protein